MSAIPEIGPVPAYNAKTEKSKGTENRLLEYRRGRRGRNPQGSRRRSTFNPESPQLKLDYDPKNQTTAHETLDDLTRFRRKRRLQNRTLGPQGRGEEYRLTGSTYRNRLTGKPGPSRTYLRPLPNSLIEKIEPSAETLAYQVQAREIGGSEATHTELLRTERRLRTPSTYAPNETRKSMLDRTEPITSYESKSIWKPKKNIFRRMHEKIESAVTRLVQAYM